MTINDAVNSKAPSGKSSKFASETALGGGGGGWEISGANGGSGGGGAASDTTAYQGGTGTSGQGNNGGGSTMSQVGGGGGAGGPGDNSGDAGDGLQYNITGTMLWYAGGAGGSGGVNGQGAAPAYGGGGYRINGGGHMGGSGIVVISYDTSYDDASSCTGVVCGDILTIVNGKKIYTFNNTGCSESSPCTITFAAVCPAGEYGDGTSCSPCPNDATSTKGSNSVESDCFCPQDTYGDYDSGCTDCPAGTASNENSTSVDQCNCITANSSYIDDSC